MPIDANGIHQYTEDDEEALFSELLNLLAASTSTRVGAIATTLSRLGFAVAAGTLATPALASQATATATIAYPAGRFTTPPILIPWSGEARTSVGRTGTVSTKDQQSIVFANFTSAAAGAATGAWIAVQMKPTAAAG